jgi:hypothetical protein
LHDPHPTNLSRRGAGPRAARLPGGGPSGEPGRVIPFGAADVPAARRSLLVTLGPEGRASLFFLRSETGFPEEELLRCALGLEREGLVTVEGRPDGNTSRRMVALTAAGRSRCVEGEADTEERGAGGAERAGGGGRGCGGEGGACGDR